jgi:hypothetical protein
MRMNRQPLSLKVLAAYARDIGTGVVRIDHRSMDSLGVISGAMVEVIGKKDGVDAKCYPLLPSDENQGITRIDPDIRKRAGIAIEDTVTIRNLAPVPPENFADEKLSGAMEAREAKGTHAEDHATRGDAEDRNSIPEEGEISEFQGDTHFSAAKFVLSGSCINFDKERNKLMDFMNRLEVAAHSKSNCKCYSDGKKALGWDFFLLEVDEGFAEKLRNIYPDMDKQEAGTSEERFALWMNKQLKKSKLEFYLKLNDIPQDKVSGFRLDPDFYRDKAGLDDLR